jgi:hypothetical protein
LARNQTRPAGPFLFFLFFFPRAHRPSWPSLATRRPSAAPPLFLLLRPLTGGTRLSGLSLTFSRVSRPSHLSAAGRYRPPPRAPRLQIEQLSRGEAPPSLPLFKSPVTALNPPPP